MRSNTGTVLLSKAYKTSERWLDAFDNGYGRLLAWALGHKKTVIIIAGMVFISSVSLVPFLSTSFIAQMDSGDISIALRMPEATRLEETKKVVEQMLKIIGETVKPEELKNSFAFGGQTKEGFGLAIGFEEAPNVAQVFVKLVDKERRKRSASEIANELRKKIYEIPGMSQVNIKAQDPTTSMLMGGQKPIAIDVQGDDLDQCIAFAGKIKNAIKDIPGLVDLSLSQKDEKPELLVEIDRAKASSLGLTSGAVSGMLRNYFYGLESTKFWDAGDSYEIFTRLGEKDKDNLETLKNAPMFTPDGRRIKLGNIAQDNGGLWACGDPEKEQAEDRQGRGGYLREITGRYQSRHRGCHQKPGDSSRHDCKIRIGRGRAAKGLQGSYRTPPSWHHPGVHGACSPVRKPERSAHHHVLSPFRHHRRALCFFPLQHPP